MKKFLLLLVIILSINVSGCSNNQKLASDIPTTKVADASDTKIIEEDINDGKQVIKNYFSALKTGNLQEVDKTLGKYKQGLFNKENISKWTPELNTIEYPGKKSNANIPPSSYKSNYGKDPYKSMSFYVTFTEGSEKKGWDYILVKESKESTWVIHDWGN